MNIFFLMYCLCLYQKGNVIICSFLIFRTVSGRSSQTTLSHCSKLRKDWRPPLVGSLDVSSPMLWRLWEFNTIDMARQCLRAKACALALLGSATQRYLTSSSGSYQRSAKSEWYCAQHYKAELFLLVWWSGMMWPMRVTQENVQENEKLKPDFPSDLQASKAPSELGGPSSPFLSSAFHLWPQSHLVLCVHARYPYLILSWIKNRKKAMGY